MRFAGTQAIWRDQKGSMGAFILVAALNGPGLALTGLSGIGDQVSGCIRSLPSILPAHSGH